MTFFACVKNILNKNKNKKYVCPFFNVNFFLFFLILFSPVVTGSTVPSSGCELGSTIVVLESLVYLAWLFLLTLLTYLVVRSFVVHVLPASLIAWIYWTLSTAISGIGLILFTLNQLDRVIRFNPQSLPVRLQPDFDAAVYRDRQGVLLERYRDAGAPVLDLREVSNSVDWFLKVLTKTFIITIIFFQLLLTLATTYVMYSICFYMHSSSCEVSRLLVNMIVAKQFCPPSALNGNNGSWTNSDDTMAARRANLNNRGTGGKSKVSRGPQPPDKAPGGVERGSDKKDQTGDKKEEKEKEKYVPDEKPCIIYATSTDTFLSDPYNRMYHSMLQASHDMEIGLGVFWYVFFSILGSVMFQDFLKPLFNNTKHALHYVMMFPPTTIRRLILFQAQTLAVFNMHLNIWRFTFPVSFIFPVFRGGIRMLGRWYRWFDEYNDHYLTASALCFLLLDGFLNADFSAQAVADKVQQMSDFTTDAFIDIRARLKVACNLQNNLRANVAHVAQAQYGVLSRERWEYCFSKAYTKTSGQIDLLAHSGVIMAANSKYDQKLYDAFSKDSRGVVANLTTFKNLMWKAAQHNNDYAYLNEFMVSTTTKFLNDVMFDTVAGIHAVGKKEVIMTI